MTNTFEKQRDYLVQEIASAMDSVVNNLETLNRSLNESIQVGKEFENVGRLWSSFYDGELKGGQMTQDAEAVQEIEVLQSLESQQGLTQAENISTP